MLSFVIDSSVFIALLYQNDVFHKDTKRFFQDTKSLLDQSRFFLPVLILFETSNFFRLKHRKNYRAYLDFQKNVFNDPRFTIFSLDLEFLLAFQNISGKKIPLRTADAIVTFTAFINKSILITWDKDLLLKSKKTIKSFTPLEFLHSQK